MKIINSTSSFHETFPSGSSLTLGNFDGIHLGHRTLLDRTVEVAKQKGIPSVVVTYFPNPSVVLGKKQNFKYLTTQVEKQKLIEEFGIDYLIVLEFTEALSRMSAEDFLEKIIIQGLNAKHIVIGYNHFFGAGRRGDFQLLQDNSSKFGYDVEQKDAVSEGEEKISSSQIRKFLESGEIDRANRLLGRLYHLEGVVTDGAKRGRTIGFPTANLSIPEERLLPAIGVYSCYTIVGSRKFKSMVNVGKNPTFDGEKLHVEVNLFDFSEDLYGQTVQIQLVQKIRDEVKFDGIESLKKQLEQDKKTSLGILN
ncbi:bifunctional riboflavin kinase/FAD synthetase [Leptospira idonii]|uniref:Riboflavin biosynthesis protein n=1 Tax=Leptospira idonii TaxID=1193500 RepID=A0A4R9LWL8_9LEPT|nr:bifunctional riboflavin kinase/FAD synthetase [Leptospira idonii]TGN17357.1 bifunctional riboflavin kinase/FAD synthetase [Leptospira idonii]